MTKWKEHHIHGVFCTNFDHGSSAILVRRLNYCEFSQSSDTNILAP